MNVKIFQELIKQDTQNSMKLVNVNVDYMQVFVMINKGVVKVNTDWMQRIYWQRDMW